MPISVTTGDPAARAKTSADLRYGGQEEAVKRAIAALNVSRQADQAAIDTYGAKGKTAINETFADLTQNLGINRAQTAQDLGIQAQNVGQGYRDAQSVAEAARAQGADRLAQLFNGNSAFQSGSLAAAQDPIEALAAKIIGSQAQNDATVTGNLQTWAAQQDALLGAGIAGAGRDKSNRLGSFESELLKAIADSRNSATNNEYSLNEKLLGLLQERGAYTADAAANFADTAFGQQLEAAKFNLSESEAAAQAASRAAQLALSSDENNWRRGLAEREASKTDNTDYWKQLDYDLRKQGVNQDSAQWLATQGQQDFANRMGVVELLAQAEQNGTTPQVLQYLESQGIIPPSTASANAAPAVMDAARKAQTWNSRGYSGPKPGTLTAAEARRYTG